MLALMISQTYWKLIPKLLNIYVLYIRNYTPSWETEETMNTLNIQKTSEMDDSNC